MLPFAKLDLILRRHEEVSARLSAGPDAATFVALARELSDNEDLVTAIRAYRDKQAEIDGIESMLAEPALDEDMRSLAEAEQAEAAQALAELETTIRLALLPKDAADAKSAILEIRAGTGGDEAALFAGDLFRMYARYADLHRWKVEVLSVSEGTAGGYKEIVAEVQGNGVFAKLKFESGVHRVQRVPDTETQGRIHTSAATVAVLPEAEEVDVAINEADHQDRYDAGAGRRRPARQQDRVGDPTHASPDRASWSSCRKSARSIATVTRRWRCFAPASSTCSARNWMASVRPIARPRSVPATARNGSEPTTSRRAG